VETAPSQSHRHAWGAPADRLNPIAGPAAEGDRRLQGLDTRPMSRAEGPLEAIVAI